jgi:hypothetical protein
MIVGRTDGSCGRKIGLTEKIIPSVCVLVIIVGAAVAAPRSAEAYALWGQSALGELTGSRNSNHGIAATDGWANGNFVLSWVITRDEATALWTYQYSASVVRKDISHFILEVSQDSRPFDSYAGTDTKVVGPQIWDGSDGNSNPLMPRSIYGVKFDFGGSKPTYTIVTDRAPVYGVFYAKDGKDSGQNVVAWSDALAVAEYKTSESLTATDFIVRPDSILPVPVPATVFLLGSGLIGLAGARRGPGRGACRSCPPPKPTPVGAARAS